MASPVPAVSAELELAEAVIKSEEAKVCETDSELAGSTGAIALAATSSELSGRSATINPIAISTKMPVAAVPTKAGRACIEDSSRNNHGTVAKNRSESVRRSPDSISLMTRWENRLKYPGGGTSCFFSASNWRNVMAR